MKTYILEILFLFNRKNLKNVLTYGEIMDYLENGVID